MSKQIARNNIPEGLEGFSEWLEKSDYHSRDVAYNYHTLKGTEHYIMLGAILCKARDKEDWVKAGCDNFFQWVENEKRTSRTQAQRMMKIWDTFGSRIEEYYKVIVEIPYVNLYEVARIAPKLEDKEVLELLHAAAVNTERHFKDNIKELEGKLPTDKCDHINLENWHRCRRCGKFIKANDNDSM